jgi:hypothetical protein
LSKPIPFDQQIGTDICNQIADGLSLVEICRKNGFPHRRRVHEWIAENVEGFAHKYARAREIQAERYAEEIVSIADALYDDCSSEQVQAARLKVDARKWAASKLAPKKYGDKVSHEHGSDPDRPVVNRVEMVFVRSSDRST